MKTKIFFIGTGSAKTSLKKFHTSLLVTASNTNLLIDCGDGISRKLKELQFDINTIQNILITHLHPDHFSGLATLLVQMKLQKRTKPLNIFIHNDLVNFIILFFDQIYLFKERLPFNLNLCKYDFEKIIKINDGFNFISKQNSHLTKYSNSETNNSISFVSPSFLFEIVDKKLHYTSDIGDKKDLNLFNSEIDVLVAEAIHIEFSDIFEFIKNKSIKKCFIVHFDEDKEDLIKKFFKNEITEGKVFIPNDGNEYFL